MQDSNNCQTNEEKNFFYILWYIFFFQQSNESSNKNKEFKEHATVFILEFLRFEIVCLLIIVIFVYILDVFQIHNVKILKNINFQICFDELLHSFFQDLLYSS